MSTLQSIDRLYKRLLIGILLALCWLPARAQDTIRAQVVDQNGQGVFAANVRLLSQPSVGTITDMNGNFSLPMTNLSLNDTIQIIFAGLQSQRLALSAWEGKEMLLIQMTPRERSLEEVMIEARRPISEQFSIVRMSKLDIYLSPVAAADPLRAVTALPASTNPNESANPELRGSSASRSRVVLNGVPIYQPVRNSQINGIGNFSIFNTELLQEQLVYASNPPLVFGNASGGLIALNTTQKVQRSEWQFSAGMANLGVFRTQQLKNGAFFHAYSNFQFPDLFLRAHPQSLDFLQDFGNLDGGLHYGIPLGQKQKWFLQGLSYGIRERYAAETNLFTYQGIAQAEKQRHFHVTHLQYRASKFFLSFRGGWDQGRERYQFGNIRSNRSTRQLYASAEVKGFVGSDWMWQAGVNLDDYQRQFRDSSARFYYALDPLSPIIESDTAVRRPIREAYAYLKYDPTAKTHISIGLRSNLPTAEQASFLSFQGSVRQDLGSGSSLLLSAGRYHSYSIPGFFLRGTELLRADQIALDYQLKRTRWDVSAAIFAKNELGSQANGEIQIRQSQIVGLELFARFLISPHLSLSLANTYLRNRVRFDPEGRYYQGKRDFPFFLKTALAYNHPRYFNMQLLLISRPGTFYNPILSGRYQPALDVYEPVYGNDIYPQRLGPYHNLSLSISRMMSVPNGSLILYLNLNNVLNRDNPQAPIYSSDYQEETFSPFSKRTLYAGLVWRWQD